MPGVVKALFVGPGDKVQKGDRLAILEAMKMEHALVAGMDGHVAEVPCSEGAQVSAGDVLILMEEIAE
jgi:3-methylcrotonyl-CoA carboxylase alpha subunit